jgi:hypothetical protein
MKKKEKSQRIMQLLMESEKISGMNFPGIDQYPSIVASKYINLWENIAALQSSLKPLKQKGQRI